MVVYGKTGIMKATGILLLLLSGAANAKMPSFAPLKSAPAAPVCKAPVVDVNELQKNIFGLNRYIGSYPIHTRDEAELESVKQQWSVNLENAEKLHEEEGDTERALALLAETYRQGHNMDTKGAAQHAREILDACLAKYPQSVSCNFSAAYFYLSISPMPFDKVEAALSTLRQHYGDTPDAEVERGFTFLYLYQRNKPAAMEQIDRYLRLFPENPAAPEMQKIRSALETNEITVKNN